MRYVKYIIIDDNSGAIVEILQGAEQWLIEEARRVRENHDLWKRKFKRNYIEWRLNVKIDI